MLQAGKIKGQMDRTMPIVHMSDVVGQTSRQSQHDRTMPFQKGHTMPNQACMGRIGHCPCDVLRACVVWNSAYSAYLILC